MTRCICLSVAAERGASVRTRHRQQTHCKRRLRTPNTERRPDAPTPARRPTELSTKTEANVNFPLFVAWKTQMWRYAFKKRCDYRCSCLDPRHQVSQRPLSVLIPPLGSLSVYQILPSPCILPLRHQGMANIKRRKKIKKNRKTETEKEGGGEEEEEEEGEGDIKTG